jgi:hypothetical protein
VKRIFKHDKYLSQFWPNKEILKLQHTGTHQKRPNCIHFFKIVFYSGMDASFPEILFFTQSWFLPPLRRLWGKPGSNPGLLRDSLVSANGLNHLTSIPVPIKRDQIVFWLSVVFQTPFFDTIADCESGHYVTGSSIDIK